MTECFELIDRKLLKGPVGHGRAVHDLRSTHGRRLFGRRKGQAVECSRTQNHGSILYSAFSTKSLSALPVAAVGPVSTVMFTVPVAWSGYWSCTVWVGVSGPLAGAV